MSANAAIEPLHIPRKIWTKAEAERLSLDGLSLELIGGELIDKSMGKKPPHVYWVTVVGKWLRQQFGEDYVRAENPIDVSAADNPTSDPEPDWAVTTDSILVTRGANPNAATLRLVVEISASTYDLDRVTKAVLYARAGIREYWIVDIRNENSPRLIRHLDPANGEYKAVTIHDQNETISFHGREFRLADGSITGGQESLAT